ncbi:hypothetical protein [Sessilibacter corallicola]|uniref:Uncharacterized protein n=1 Tax=Sessilibacter corallicola TaxID=2904075 RepID=A0ABQ0A9J6_9GAMM
MPKEDAILLLNQLSPNFEAYEKEGRLNTTWLHFKISEQGNVLEEGACQ